jgi:hypothetical protein
MKQWSTAAVGAAAIRLMLDESCKSMFYLLMGMAGLVGD